jgi:hypothetical protein
VGWFFRKVVRYVGLLGLRSHVTPNTASHRPTTAICDDSDNLNTVAKSNHSVMAEPDIERDTDLTREMAPELDYVIPRDDPGQAHSALAAAGAYAYRHLLNIGRMFGRLHSVRHRGGEADSETHNHNELDPAREDEPPDTPRRFAWFYDKIRQNISLWQNKIVPEDGYTTAAFNNLHRPLPVKDVFFSARLIIVCRLVFRGAIYCSVLPILVNPNGIILLGITGVVAVLRNYKIERVWKVRVPTVRELWSFVKYPQTFWVCALKSHHLRMILKVSV